ncbi:hypothetical protein PFISCL1PPCAC_15719 [Pristionchus fissidentatus]|uniref:Cortactin-binding protein-2 N-terminal domain-containing protein n=1 Tax=Pristionchus fissidentatus TaxID=1538716 RepID=A0AAV5W0A7_9BILA|nr:hypothetical protein PFISCL1PPCAC_15719 [Pristionchus fissidentatus]
MEFHYDEATRKMATQPNDSFPAEFTRENLVQLLLYLEGEIQNRDRAILSLKEDKVRLLSFEAKYSRACPSDPVHALSRDSNFVQEFKLQTTVGELFDNQVEALEKISSGYNEAYRRTAHMAKSAENRYDMAMHDLEVEREWKKYAVSNESVQSLREENSRLKGEVERLNNEVILSKKEIAESNMGAQDESERHKKIVIFLMNERKEMLATMSEMKFRNNASDNTVEQTSLIEELRKQVEVLIGERDAIKNVNKSMKGEIIALKEVARTQEEDLHLMKKTLVGATKGMSIDRNMVDGSMVMANRIAMSAPARSLSSSSSFPCEKSRLPRAPGLSPSTNLPIASKTIIAKKTPAMGLSTMRRTVERRGMEGEEQSRLTRSSSLRGQSEPRPIGPPLPSIRPSTLPKSISNGANDPSLLISSPSIQSSTLSRLPSKSDGKATQATKSKNSLLRAFGK